MSETKYMLISGCNGISLNRSFANLTEVYLYITNNKLERGTYELYKVERIINEDF